MKTQRDLLGTAIVVMVGIICITTISSRCKISDLEWEYSRVVNDFENLNKAYNYRDEEHRAYIASIQKKHLKAKMTPPTDAWVELYGDSMESWQAHNINLIIQVLNSEQKHDRME